MKRRKYGLQDSINAFEESRPLVTLKEDTPPVDALPEETPLQRAAREMYEEVAARQDIFAGKWPRECASCLKTITTSIVKLYANYRGQLHPLCDSCAEEKNLVPIREERNG